MVKRTFDTPDGVIEKELTEEEIRKFAEVGEPECSKEILKRSRTGTLQQRIEAIEKFLGV